MMTESSKDPSFIKDPPHMIGNLFVHVVPSLCAWIVVGVL